ncbi:MAG: putrescine aminotransferase [Lentisphaerae bacterium]|nr:putrescine aminotransferase [Lentisphaerota bacterium]
MTANRTGDDSLADALSAGIPPEAGDAPSDPVHLPREEVRRRSVQYLNIAMSTVALTSEERSSIQKHTLANFDDYVDRGWLNYRKSVAEAGDHATIEWTGQGSIIQDLQGREFIDCLGGFGTYAMGIRHPKIVAAVKAQADRMPLSSQELLDPFRGFLAELLGELTPGALQECFFACNGTDAIDGALKLARLYTKKSGFISTTGAFHGKSLGALSVMGKAIYRKPFQPLLEDIYFADYGDVKDIEREFRKGQELGEEIAAVILEPVQGEAGAIVPPADYLPRVRELCDEYKALLILDEVQTGMGRTGRNFACEHWKVVPDILCLGKALGGGVMPLSCFMSTPEIWHVLEDNPFVHSSTFGGNPLSCVAGIAAINVMLEEELPRQAASKGAYLLKHLRSLQQLYPDVIRDVHGLGLLIGVEFFDAKVGYNFAAGLFRRGVLVAGTLLGLQTVRIEPALNIPMNLLERALDRIRETLEELEKNLDPKAREKAQKQLAKQGASAASGAG